jgi:hypothetical protein
MATRVLHPALLLTLLAACVAPPPGGGRASGGPGVPTPVEAAWMDEVEPMAPGQGLEASEKAFLADALGRLEIPDEFSAYARALRGIVELGPRVVPWLGWYADHRPPRNAPPDTPERARARETCALLLETVLDGMETVPVLAHLDSDSASAVVAAAAVLGERESREALPALVDLLGDGREPVRRAAIASLRRITNEFHGYRPDAPSGQRRLAIERWKRYLDQEA